MRISVLPRADRLRRTLGTGLSRPILGAFALVLVEASTAVASARRCSATGFIRHRHRVVTASGAVRWLSEDGVPECIAGVIEDVTEEHRAQRYGAAERAVQDLLSGAGDTTSAMPSILEALCRRLDRDLAGLWTPDEAGDRRSSRAAGAPAAARARRSSSRRARCPSRWATASPASRGRSVRRSGAPTSPPTSACRAAPRRHRPACAPRWRCRSPRAGSRSALTARADAALYMAKRGGRAQAVLV